jgi:histidinol dehydrogenase
LLSQAEHGVDSQVVLVAVDLTGEHLAEIEEEVNKQALALERVDIVRQSIAKSNIVMVKTVEEGIAFSNDYAPEHLILHLENASDKVAQIDNAGSIFVGAYTPERLVPEYSQHSGGLLTYFIAVATTPLEQIIPFPPMAMLANSVASTRSLSKNI